MAFTTDVTTDIGKVRLLLFDLDVTKPIFPDDSMIQAFLNMELGDVKQGAALGLETIAGNRLLTLQVIQLLDLKTDGVSMAKGLLEQAKRLRDFSNNDWAGFDVAEVTDNSLFALREKYYKLLMAQSI
jgi:hypothetical protein